MNTQALQGQSVATSPSTIIPDVTQVLTARQLFAKELEEIKSFAEPDSEAISGRWLFLGAKTKKFALVLDLDDTLILCCGAHTDPRELATHIRLRPHAKDLLAHLSSIYEVIIYTAAEEGYASTALKLLDPELKYVKRLVTRPHCFPLSNGMLVKDLRIFADRNVEEMLIADNSVLSFPFQLANGIPVSPYCGNEDDTELLRLRQYLEELSMQPDIVSANRAQFGLC
jgi:CTD small phosphatase-like protein 2